LRVLQVDSIEQLLSSSMKFTFVVRVFSVVFNSLLHSESAIALVPNSGACSSVISSVSFFFIHLCLIVFSSAEVLSMKVGFPNCMAKSMNSLGVACKKPSKINLHLVVEAAHVS